MFVVNGTAGVDETGLLTLTPQAGADASFSRWRGIQLQPGQPLIGKAVDVVGRDLTILQDAGVDGVMFCNEADLPYQLRPVQPPPVGKGGVGVDQEEERLVAEERAALGQQFPEVILEPPHLAGASATVSRRVHDDRVVFATALDFAAHEFQAIIDDVADGSIGEAGETGVFAAPFHHAFGGIDMIVNNAGVSMHAWFEDITDLGTFERLFRVNVMSMVWITHKALPHIEHVRGEICAQSDVQVQHARLQHALSPPSEQSSPAVLHAPPPRQVPTPSSSRPTRPTRSRWTAIVPSSGSVAARAATLTVTGAEPVHELPSNCHCVFTLKLAGFLSKRSCKVSAASVCFWSRRSSRI